MSYMIICEVGIKMIKYWHYFVKSMFVYLGCRQVGRQGGG
jgi:hypothetical protein